MKNLFALFILLCCSSAHADCQDEWLHYGTLTRQLAVIYKDGCYQGDLILMYWNVEKGHPCPS